MSTYSYSESLLTPCDHARFQLGDIEVGTDGEGRELGLLPDETINAQLSTYGWQGGLRNLASSLLARFGQEPVKLDEGNGISFDMSARIAQWYRVMSDAQAGLIPDPTLVSPSTVGSHVSSGAFINRVSF